MSAISSAFRAAPGPAGCAETYPHGVRIGVRFTNFLSPETLRLVVRADFMPTTKPMRRAPCGADGPSLLLA